MVSAEEKSVALIAIQVRPRVQKDRWSLYWKESMETKTDLLKPLSLDVSPDMKVSELHAKVAAAQSWPDTKALERLEGFKDPWEISVFKGRQMAPDKTLEKHGVGSGSAITIVRRVLVPEGWKIIEEGQDEDDISSDEEW